MRSLLNKDVRKNIRRNISGVLLLDKALCVSSNQAVQMVKQLFSAAKCGHTGTLDPMATGLLPLCLGEATKFSSMLLCADKTYQATLKLGYLSTTGDIEGEISQVAVYHAPTLERCQHVLTQFIGTIQQIPPMYSALKHQGRPLYAYARDGKTVERPARQIQIYQLDIESLNGDQLCLTIHCSTGTYIRTLAEDIGKALGCGGAYLTQLRRTRIDCFDITQAHTVETLKTFDLDSLDQHLLPVDCLLKNFPSIILDDEAIEDIIQGRTICNLPNTSLLAGDAIRLYNSQQQFIGLGIVTEAQKLIAKRLMATNTA